MKGYYLMPHPPIMIPEVGNGKEEEIRETIKSCEIIRKEIKHNNIETIIIITPHGNVFRDGVCIIDDYNIEGDLSRFGVSDVYYDLKIDRDITKKILEYCMEEEIPVVNLNKDKAKLYNVRVELDHGALVPLYNILRNKQYKIVHITYGLLSPIELYKFGMQIKKAAEEMGDKTAFISSGDLSHRLSEDGPYDYSPYGKKFDRELIGILERGNIEGLFKIDEKLILEAGECGLRSLYVLAGALDGVKVKGNLLSYEAPFGVGYAVMKFDVKNGKSLYNNLIFEKEERHRRRKREGNPYTRLARLNIENFFNTRASVRYKDIKDEELLGSRRGVFVSLKIRGDLRGCVGTIKPTTECIGNEIIKNSLSAAFNDPRFSELRKDELLECDISVDILHESEICKNEDLDPKIYGVIVQNEENMGLLLPNLDGIEDADTQVSIALQKGNISPYENYILKRFKVDRFEEVD